MKLARFGHKKHEAPALMMDDASTLIDLTDVITDFDGRFFSEGGLNFLKTEFASGNLDVCPKLPASSVRIAAPVSTPSKILCVGQNYMDHIKEQDAPVPPNPVLFSKATTTLIGPYDNVLLPHDETTADYEVELAIIIGRNARRVIKEEAQNYIAAVTILNDVTERRVQKHEGGQWHRGKSFDTYCPLGPWATTLDEMPDLQTLNLSMTVNNEEVQNSNTKQMIFTVAELIEFASRNITLNAGDILSTGTPPGVGAFRKPPIFLKEGDTMSAKIDGLGEQKNKLLAE